MEKSLNELTKDLDKLQFLLPVGYLYLILLGIVKETLLFLPLGINILQYSSISDILLSPLAEAFANPINFFMFFGLAVFAWYTPFLLKKYGHKKWVLKMFGIRKSAEELAAKGDDYFRMLAVENFAKGCLMIFIGYGFAVGVMERQTIKQGDGKLTHTITFNSGQVDTVRVVETNSVYFFYVPKGGKSLSAAPVGAIQQIQKLP
jgi:hypothetical protein